MLTLCKISLLQNNVNNSISPASILILCSNIRPVVSVTAVLRLNVILYGILIVPIWLFATTLRLILGSHALFWSLLVLR